MREKKGMSGCDFDTLQISQGLAHPSAEYWHIHFGNKDIEREGGTDRHVERFYMLFVRPLNYGGTVALGF